MVIFCFFSHDCVSLWQHVIWSRTTNTIIIMVSFLTCGLKQAIQIKHTCKILLDYFLQYHGDVRTKSQFTQCKPLMQSATCHLNTLLKLFFFTLYSSRVKFWTLFTALYLVCLHNFHWEWDSAPFQKNLWDMLRWLNKSKQYILLNWHFEINRIGRVDK